MEIQKSLKQLIREQLIKINENQSIVDNILDKISQSGLRSLDKEELKYLNQYSEGIIDQETEKQLSISRNEIFLSKDPNLPQLKFIYYGTKNYGNEIIHKGKFTFNNDKEFEGSIFADGNNNFEYAEFTLNKGFDDEHYTEGDNLYYVAEGLEHEIDRFFSDDVVPYLLFN